MKSAMKHIFTVLLLLLCVSCISDRETRAVLDQVEALIDENPAEAYELVKGIDGAAISSSAVNARYALLYTKAEYKNYIDAPNDSLISIAADYYERHGSDQEKFYAYLYQGCVNYGIKDYTSSMKAVDVLLKANDYVDAVDNYKDVGLMYIQLATLYGEQQSSDEEACARKAYMIYQDAGFDSRALNALGHIAVSKFHKREYDSCFCYVDTMLHTAYTLNNRVYISHALSIKAQCAIEVDSITLAASLYNQLLEDNEYQLNSQDYSRLSVISASTNDYDAADHYLSLAINEARNFNDSIYYYAMASKVYRHAGKDTFVYAYQDSVLLLENEMLNIGLEHTALASQKEYAEHLLITEKYKYRLHGCICICILVVVVSLLISVAGYAKHQKLLATLQLEKIKSLQAEIEQHRQENIDALQLLSHTEIVLLFQASINNMQISIKETDWSELYRMFCKLLPSFEQSLKSIHDLSQIEWRVCMLLKLGFTSSEIAKITNKSSTAIPSIRSRLYKKFFMTNGKASDWDAFIASI